ncbi:uncharacterized protein LOC129241358 isoform X2 [Anastrepha obliqua]|uniref:uncharacterized protein LOC129241358 isoform X2 n=1 Tax=Anastrepha obliqua TaxID=95512 RepID=UPI0024097388|nr:uncharacterized protein LOC129241358 isoform X2 [Anastrepha obliqua]
MNFFTVFCLLIASVPINILVNAKCRPKAPVDKVVVDKPKQTQENNPSDEISPVPQHKPKCKTSKTNETSAQEAQVLVSKSHQTDEIEEDEQTKQANDTKPSALSLAIEFSYPKGKGFSPDSNSPGQPDLSRQETELGYNGYLYDVFKKRLNQVFRELYNNVNTPPVTAAPPQTEYENDKSQKRSAVSNCLYEEFKRRLDKFNNEFMEPAKAIKRTSGKFGGGNRLVGGKRSTVQESLYEEYKRRLDKLGNELWLDGEKVFDRSGRGAAPGMLPFTPAKQQLKPKRSATDTAAEQDFYGEYKKKLDQLTRELYQQSNERLSRTYDHLTEHGLSAPTLQRLVAAVQLDDAKSVKGESRDRSGTFEGSTILLKIDKSIDNFDKLQDKRSLDATDVDARIFGADSLDFMTGVASGVDATAAASYPAVLTRSLDANLGLLGNTGSKNMLAMVASKMNMSTLDLAKKLASLSNPLEYVAKKDPQLGAEMQKLIDISVSKLSQSPSGKKLPRNEASLVPGLPLVAPAATAVPASLMPQDALYGAISALAGRHTSVTAKAVTATPTSAAPTTATPTTLHTPTEEPTRNKAAPNSQLPASCTAQSNDAEAKRIAGVLDKVLSKLELIQECKANAEPAELNCAPDGIPCDVVGSWNSYAMGLRFDIALNKAADRRLGMAEKNNKLLTIEVSEREPPHAHHIIDTGWKFMGSTLNQQGGPFYIYSQNRELSIVSTFIGYCRICGGIDTIFGSWTIMGPSRDCQDVTTALENRRDIFRRYNMENKRNRHFKDILFEKSKYSKSQCNKNG